MSKLAPGTYVTGKEYRTADGERVEIVAPEGFVGALSVRREPVPLDGTSERYWRFEVLSLFRFGFPVTWASNGVPVCHIPEAASYIAWPWGGVCEATCWRWSMSYHDPAF